MISGIYHLSLISLPKANIKHSLWLWIRVRQSRWLFYQLEFADIFDSMSDSLEELTRHKQLASTQCQIRVELTHKSNCTHKASNVFICTCAQVFVWPYAVMECHSFFNLFSFPGRQITLCHTPWHLITKNRAPFSVLMWRTAETHCNCCETVVIWFMQQKYLVRLTMFRAKISRSVVQHKHIMMYFCCALNVSVGWPYVNCITWL